MVSNNLTKQFDIDGVVIGVARASAVKQDELLSLITPSLARVLTNLGTDESKVENALALMCTALPYEIKTPMDRILLAQCFDSSGAQIDHKFFDGRVMMLNRLRAKVLHWNLADFFTFWASVQDADKVSEPISNQVQ